MFAINTFRVEYLSNGFYRVDHRPTGMVNLYNADGTKRSGSLRIPHSVVCTLLGIAQ